MPDKEAVEIRKLKKWRGDARLYRLNPPIESTFDPWFREGTDEADITEYIVISSVSSGWYRSETMVFASTKSGKTSDDTNPMEHALDVSKEKNHEKVLKKMGYTLVSAQPKVKKVAEVKPTRYLRLED